jgi:hypothetical protein
MSFIFSFISLSGKNREHTLRLTGLFSVSAIALFSNNTWCFFAAIFIVATAVTQLEFLQNLAAIIRGSKEFFDYQKEFLTAKEVEEATAKDVTEFEEAEEAEVAEVADEDEELEVDNGVHAHIASNVTIDNSNLTPQQFAIMCEEYAFRYLERKYKKPIQRHIRFRGGTIATEFDGILQNKKHDIVFEIKVSRRKYYPIHFIHRTVDEMVQRVKSYTFLTKRSAGFSMVFVGDFTKNIHDEIYSLLTEIRPSYPEIQITFEIVSFKEIGLEGLVDNVEKKAKQ